MTIEELRVLLTSSVRAPICGCGDPEAALRALLELLRLHPLHDAPNRAALEERLPDEGLRYLVLYFLDSLELTEHGGTVDYGWLSERGREALALLERGAEDDFEDLLREACVHGHAFEDDCPGCAAEFPASENGYRSRRSNLLPRRARDLFERLRG